MKAMNEVHFCKVMTSQGDFKKVANIEAIMDSLANLLSIKRGTYPFDPEVGTELPKYIFDLNDEFTQESIKDEIKATLAQDERVHILDINVYKIPNGLLFELHLKVVNGPTITGKFSYSSEQANLIDWNSNE